MTDHVCRYIAEQQTHHRYCALCGRHDPPNARCADQPSGLWRMLNDPAWQQTHRAVVTAVRRARPAR